MDREDFQLFVEYADKMEQRGIKYGLFFGTALSFFPIIRRTPFYVRIPVFLGTLAFCMRVAKNYGDSVAWSKCRYQVEMLEAELSLRHKNTFL